MKVIATNLGQPTTILWNNKEEQTGIFKYPTKEPIHLGVHDVVKDTVIDRKHHGGEYKACYLFSAKHYAYWKNLYPNLSWDWGMFGENITIDALDESSLTIGSIYQLGTALVQITQPREPCYKLGIRFNDQKILKQFIDHGHPGTYIKVLKEGMVTTGDAFTLVESSNQPLTVQAFYKLLFEREKNQNILQLALKNNALPQKKRDKLAKFIK